MRDADDSKTRDGRAWWCVLLALGVVAVGERLYRIDAPLIDQLYTKQIFVANKARNMAFPSWNPLRQQLDFLDERGRPMELVEEFPLYTGAVAAGYALIGEREWIGRAISIMAVVVAIGALADLAAREFKNRSLGLCAALVMAASPLLVFWGRCVLPDVCMLAAMLTAAAALRRRLDGGGLGWLILAAVATAAAGMFKPYGLMVILPLADMAWRARSRAQCVDMAGIHPRPGREFGMVALAGLVPSMAWILGVFLTSHNPTSRTVYGVNQAPGVLLSARFWEALFWRVPFKDWGWLAAIGAIVGLIAALRRRVDLRPIAAWGVMGVGFCTAFAPKLTDHDYYELGLLPAGAMLSALGWLEIGRVVDGKARFGGFRKVIPPVFGGALVLLQSPLVDRTKFEPESGHLAAAEALRGSLREGESAVVVGHPQPWAIIHYSRRRSWAIPVIDRRGLWEAEMERYRAMGARKALAYSDPLVGPGIRAQVATIGERYGVERRDAGPWYRRGRQAELAIYDFAASESRIEAMARNAGDHPTTR